MLLQRFYHDGLAQASYLLGCQKTGEALVVDANRDVAAYVAAAASQGLRITHVTETHIHADYVSGSRELAQATGAQLLLSAEGGDDWQYAFAEESQATLLRDGDTFRVGNVRIDVVHTPGHTPEHVTFVVTDTPASDRPVGAFTGDFIFVGDVGRPDLLERAAHVQGTMRASAALLFRSLRRFAASQPDFLQLWPGHGSGSACGKSLGAVPQSTLGYERVSNWALQLEDEDRFIEAVLEGQPDPPHYFATMKRVNREGPALVGEGRAIPRHPPSALGQVLADGAQVVDLRPAERYAEGFVPGTLNLPLNRSFVGWAGWLLSYEGDIHFVVDGDDATQATDAAHELRMIGLDRVAGRFGPDALATWAEVNGALATMPQLSPEAAAERAASDEAQIVDVRALDEWDAGHIDGALHLPLGRLRERADEIDAARPVILQCQGGGRSAIAASLLRGLGVEEVYNLRGGITAWIEAGLPTDHDPAVSGA